MKKAWKIAIIIIILVVLSIVLIRLATGEDNWICKGGKWIKHGNPLSARPAEPCEETFIQKIFDSKQP
jgi:hypothetical protein